MNLLATYQWECNFAIPLNEASLFELSLHSGPLHFAELAQDAIVSHLVRHSVYAFQIYEHLSEL